jgi:hypothetical protein
MTTSACPASPARSHAPRQPRLHLVAAALLLGAACAAAADDNAERWVELEPKVDTAGFPAAFIDSLRTVSNVVHGASLRSIPSAVFDEPEKVVLEARWGPFRAGYAIMHFGGDPASGLARTSVIAVTTRLISRLYKVRDFIRSTMDLAGVYPLFFEEHIEEGRYKKARWTLYDHAGGAVYSNKKNHEHAETPAFAFDYLSLLCYLRSLPLAPGDTFSLECYVQGKVYSVFFRCGERDRVRTELGEFDCVVLEPKFVAEGRNFSRRDRVHLWLTDDPLHALVKVRAKLKVGSVDGELIYYQRGGEVKDRPAESRRD